MIKELNLLSKLMPIYKQIFKLLKDSGAEWIQVDEPILSLDLDKSFKNKFISTYDKLVKQSPKILLTSFSRSGLLSILLQLTQLQIPGIQ